MFRRFLLLLLIALLPLQGVAATFMVKCPGGAADPVMQSNGMPCHEMGAMNAEMPCHEHGENAVVGDNADNGGAPAGNMLDQGCCHHLAVAIPQTLRATGATLVHGQSYPAIVASYTDHLPDRLQRPPLSVVI